jgi:hypothetical protein
LKVCEGWWRVRKESNLLVVPWVTGGEPRIGVEWPRRESRSPGTAESMVFNPYLQHGKAPHEL